MSKGSAIVAEGASTPIPTTLAGASRKIAIRSLSSPSRSVTDGSPSAFGDTARLFSMLGTAENGCCVTVLRVLPAAVAAAFDTACD